MTTHAKGSFTITGWDEKPYDEQTATIKLAMAVVTQDFDGDIDGKGAVQYLMAYRSDGSANFVGMQRVVGKLGGRKGSFVLQNDGVYEGGTIRATWFVVPGSGMGELEGLQGRGGYEAPEGSTVFFTLDYEFE